MQNDEICRALDEAIVTDEEFAMGPESWSAWKKLVTKQQQHGHGHHGHGHHGHGHHHHSDDDCSMPDEYANHVNGIIADFFPEIADPTILEFPDESIAKLSDKEIKAALSIRQIVFGIDY